MQLEQAVITARTPGKRARAEREVDPEAEARVREFFAQMIQPPGR